MDITNITNLTNITGLNMGGGGTEQSFARYFNEAPVFSGNELIDNISANNADVINQNCIVGDGSTIFTFATVPTYDAITAVKDGSVTDITGEFATLVWTPVNLAKYNLVTFSNAGVEVAKFPLNEGASNIAHDVIGSSTCAISTATIWSTTTGLSWNFDKGYNIHIASFDSLVNNIETGIAFDGTVVIEVYGRFRVRDKYQSVMSGGESGNEMRFGMTSSGVWDCRWVGALTETTTSDLDYHLYKFTESDKKFYVDTTVIATGSDTLTSSVGIFICSKIGGVGDTADFDLVYAKIYKQGALLVDFIPQKDGSVYESISGIYYGFRANQPQTKYVPASETTPTVDVIGRTLAYAKSNAENQLNFPESVGIEAIDVDEILFDSDGNKKDIKADLIPTNSYLTTTRDSDGNIIDLAIEAADSILPTRNTDFVASGGYFPIVDTAGNINGDTDSRYYLMYDHYSRIRSNGQLEGVIFNVGWDSSISNVTGFYVQVWRKTGTLYDLIGEEEIWAKVTVPRDAIHDITFDNPITGVIEGDFIGFGIITNGTAAENILSAHAGRTSYFLNNSVPPSTDYDWEAQTEYAEGVWVYRAKMQAPQVVIIGGSKMAGHPLNYSFVEYNDVTDVPNQIGYQLQQLCGKLPYQNMGKGSQASADVLARFDEDCVDLKPNYAVINIGVSDIGTSVPKATFLSNYTAILDKCVAGNIIPIILKLFPYSSIISGYDTARMQTIDEWNVDIQTLADTYATAIAIDTMLDIGFHRVGGDAGNSWDIRPEFDSGDGIHENLLGYTRVAELIYVAIFENL